MEKRLLLSGIVIVSVAIGSAFFLQAAHDRSRVYTIATVPIADLYPHSHELGVDSMSDEGHHIDTTSRPTVAPRDLWVTGVRFDINGAPATSLHHGTLLRLDQQAQECPEESPQVLMSMAQDQWHDPEAQFPNGYGIFIPKGTPLRLDAMFHNPLPPLGPGETYHNVSLKVTLSLADASANLKPLTFHLLHLSDTPCRGSSHTFVVPPQTTYTFSGTDEVNDSSRYRPKATSTIVYWGAHLHGWEGGRDVVVYKNGTPVRTFSTIRATDDPYQFNTPHEASSLTLSPGDVLSLSATYVNDADQPIRDAMGHLGFYASEE
jgi:hypothetical protein